MYEDLNVKELKKVLKKLEIKKYTLNENMRSYEKKVKLCITAINDLEIKITEVEMMIEYR